MRKKLPDQISESKPVAAHEDEKPGGPGETGKARREREREEKVDEALDESFPASDPPAFNKTTAGSH